MVNAGIAHIGTPARLDAYVSDQPAAQRATATAKTALPALTTPQLQCYNRRPRVTTHHSRITNHASFNRQPARLEINVTLRKQTSATRLNSQLWPTFSSRFRQPASPFATSQPNFGRDFTTYKSRFTNYVASNRHTSRLENAIIPTKTHFSALLIVTICGFQKSVFRITTHQPRPRDTNASSSQGRSSFHSAGEVIPQNELQIFHGTSEHQRTERSSSVSRSAPGARAGYPAS